MRRARQIQYRQLEQVLQAGPVQKGHSDRTNGLRRNAEKFNMELKWRRISEQFPAHPLRAAEMNRDP